MDGDDGVKVGLGGAHLDGDAKALQNLVDGEADHVQAHHALLLALAHDAAALARAGSTTHGVAAGPPETATSGSVEYLAPGVCGDELLCHAAASGLSSSVRTGKGKLCSAAWGWGKSNAVA